MRGDVDGLVDALGYRNVIDVGQGKAADFGAKVRIGSLKALADLASADDVQRIGVALGDPDPVVRQSAVRVIRRLDPDGAVDLLARALVGPGGQGFTESRLEALEGLEEIQRRGGEGIARSVIFAAVDGGEAVALDRVTHDALKGFLEEASLEKVTGLIAELIERLPSMNGSLENAQVVLTWLGRTSVEPLIDSLDREGGYREPAAAVLGSIRDTRALEPLSAILEDHRADVRRVAVWALGELRDPRAAEPLMKATMDDEYVVRRQAGEALDSMGSVALMAGVANMIRSIEDRQDGDRVARLVEEGLERTPATGRIRNPDGRGWAPRFVERLSLPSRPS